MKILVTGAAGLLGTHLIEKLMCFDHEILGTFYNRPPNIYNYNIQYQQADLRNYNDCQKIVKGADLVFLCAGNTGGISRTENSAGHIIDTLQINARLLDLCSKEKVSRVFLISSSTIYPNYSTAFAEAEGFLDEPCHSYFGIGWMYRYLEKLAHYYNLSFGLPVTIIRPSNFYGPFDNFSQSGSHVIPSLIRKFLEADKVVKIWGDGSQCRDFIYASDVADFMIGLIDKPECTGPFNVGSGIGTTISDLVNEISKATNKTGLIVSYDSGMPTGPQRRLVDNSFSKNYFDYSNCLSLPEGLNKTVQWYKNLIGNSRYD